MNRKFWVLGFLASACFFGCSEGDDKGLLPSTGCNNNGVLDAGEICDGTLFATGKRVCPEGKVLADGKTVESITCSDKCMLVTEGVCVDPAPAATCGNKELDDGEACDGDKFATGKRVCPEGKVFATGKTAADIKCSDKCMLVTEGICVDQAPAATCGNKKLDDGEACDGDNFAQGKRVCPEGKVLAEGKTVENITCSNTCTVVTEGVCVDPASSAACGNGHLDEDKGEVCDGDKFATGKRVCPDGKVLADGKTVENITCSNTCTVVTEGVCVDSVPDPTNKCNGLSVDTGEDCDGDNFAPGKRVCPVGSILADGKTLADIKCSKTCTVVTEGVCIEPEPAETCGNEKLDEDKGEVCDGDKFATGKRVCPDGMEFGSGKTEADIRCTSNCLIDTSLACVQELKTKCDGTKYCICSSDDTECACEDCSEKGEICGTVDGKASCVEKTCKVSDGEFVCDGNFLGTCVADTEDSDEGHLLMENCAKEGLFCDAEEGKCGLERCTTLNETVCIGSVLRTCMEDDGANRWLDIDCEAKGQMCQNNACVDKPLCGNGINDPNEDCDPNANPQIPAWKLIDCYKYDTPKDPKLTYSKLFISGQPTCGPKCKISTDQCVEANDSDFAQVKKWSYTSMSSIIDATKSGTVVMNGVFDEHSVYNEQKGGWGLGNWTKSAFGKSITFIVGKTTKNSVKVSIDVTRTNNESPDRIKMRVLDGSTMLATTEEIIISDTKKQTLTAYARGVGSVKNLRVEFTAYFSGKENDKHVVINNIVVSEVDAL